MAPKPLAATARGKWPRPTVARELIRLDFSPRSQKEECMFESFQGTVARRRLLVGSAVSGLGALIGGASGAAAQQPPGPPGIQILQYDPPRPFAAGSRVGNIIYLAGEEAVEWTGTAWELVPGGIGPQTERIFECIRTNLRHLGSDLEYIVNMTNYFVSYSDR